MPAQDNALASAVKETARPRILVVDDVLTAPGADAALDMRQSHA